MKIYEVNGSLFWFKEGEQPDGAIEYKSAAKPADKSKKKPADKIEEEGVNHEQNTVGI